MSEYNCRVKRVVPKDCVIQVMQNPRELTDGIVQLGYTKSVMGSCMCFYRFKKRPQDPWSVWMFYYPESTWRGLRCTYWNRPGWEEISNMIHGVK